MKRSFILTLALAALLANVVVLPAQGTLLAAPNNQTAVNGNTVAYVDHAHGSFIQIGPRLWKEILNGRVGHFTEEARDEWSVYLKKTNGVRIQIDLWTKKISQLKEGNKLELYTINQSKSVNGSNVAMVRHSRGQFTMTGPGEWFENLDDRTGIFREESRDEWSVYLIKENGVRIQLDLWTGMVSQLANGQQKPLYTIDDSST
ncbi:MAG: hypothetical protein IT422_30225 [Pirellulaceae bacterium]|nr:hypothetical protein [Pirellulaceae bacterium]